jgi:hypothetical protein
VSELIPYARQAKEICDMSQAESVEDAVDQVVLNVGGGATLGLRLLKLTEDLENQSSIDQIGHAAVFALCEAAG